MKYSIYLNNSLVASFNNKFYFANSNFIKSCSKKEYQIEYNSYDEAIAALAAALFLKVDIDSFQILTTDEFLIRNIIQ